MEIRKKIKRYPEKSDRREFVKESLSRVFYAKNRRLEDKWDKRTVLQKISDKLAGREYIPERVTDELLEKKDSELFKDNWLQLGKLLKKEVSDGGVLRQALDEIIGNGNFPEVIISEDASGRILANILKVFFTKLYRKLGIKSKNIPVIAYSVGKDTIWSDDKEQTLSGGIAKKVIKILDDGEYKGPIIFTSDLIDTGKSFAPIKSLLEDRKVYFINLKEHYGYQKEDNVTYVNLNGPEGFVRLLKPIQRNTDGSLYIVETVEEAKYRRQKVDEITDKMLEIYLKNLPGKN